MNIVKGHLTVQVVKCIAGINQQDTFHIFVIVELSHKVNSSFIPIGLTYTQLNTPNSLLHIW